MDNVGEDFETDLAKMLALNPSDVVLTLRWSEPESAYAEVRGDDGSITMMEIDPKHIGLYMEALERRRIQVQNAMMY